VTNEAKTSVAKTGGPADIQSAWGILAKGSPAAATALVDIAENGKSEVARVQAATAVLDRVGLATPKERPQVTFNVIPKEVAEAGIDQIVSPAEIIRNRLKELKAPTQAVAGPPLPDEEWAAQQSDDGQVYDAELVMEGDGDWQTGGEGWG